MRGGLMVIVNGIIERAIDRYIVVINVQKWKFAREETKKITLDFLSDRILPLGFDAANLVGARIHCICRERPGQAWLALDCEVNQ